MRSTAFSFFSRLGFFRLVGVCAIAGVVLAGSTAGASTGTAKPQKGGSLNIIWSSEPAGMDPVQLRGIESDISGALVVNGVYDVLFYIDPVTYKMRPRIVESMSTSDNGLTWTLKLRSGVRFSDGTTFDAAAVQFNWERFADPSNRSQFLQVAQQVASYQVVDPLTLKVTLKAADPHFLVKASRHLAIIGSPTAIKTLGAAFSTKPVGAGPFLLKEWVRGTRMTFVRNPDYYEKGKPYLDELVVTQISDDTQRYQTVTSGGAQVALDGATVNIQNFKASGKYKVANTPSEGGYSMGMNTSKPPFNDVRLRRALSLTITSKDVVTRASLGDPETAVITTIETENSPYYDPKIKLPKQDLKEAQSLIDQIVAEQGGKPIQFTFNAFNTPNLTRKAETIQAIIQSSLKNVEMKVDVLSSTEVVRRYSIGDYQATTFGVKWTDPSVDLPAWFQSTSSINYMKYSNPAVDAAIQQLVSSSDKKVIEKADHTILENVLKDVPIIWVARFQAFNVWEKSAVHDWKMYFELRPFVDAVWLSKPKS